jgi:N-acetylglucosaminyldiphosphoundecaprenol N-acetyl-beta-D-mannosaminyltransferase
MRILTFDVEDWFHVLHHPVAEMPAAWPRLPSRVERNTHRILDALGVRGVRATFFVLGWVAEHHPAIVRRIAAEGHEIGTHSYAHLPVREERRHDFEPDLRRSVQLLEDLAGRPVTCYRAPGATLSLDHAWAFEALLAAGIQVDCSMLRAPLHGPGMIASPAGWLRELPLGGERPFGVRVRCSSAGYLLLPPARLRPRAAGRGRAVAAAAPEGAHRIALGVRPFRAAARRVRFRERRRGGRTGRLALGAGRHAGGPSGGGPGMVSAAVAGRARVRVRIGDLDVDRIGLADVVTRIGHACATRSALHIVTANIGFVTLARRRAPFRDAVNAAGCVVCDGRLLLWMSRLLGEPVPEQVTGHDLVRECIALAAVRGWRVVLLGGMPGIADELAARLRLQHPGLAVMGEGGGRFTSDGRGDDDADLVPRIRAYTPDLLLVALGAPKQELWIARQLHATGACVAIGVGGVFDTLTGHLPRAPHWMQVAGLESLFQLALAPRRYARRYLVDDPPTLARVAWHALVARLRRDP